MKQIAIYVEGGGDTAQQKAELRTGLDQLLRIEKQAVRDKRLKWKLVPAGGRDSACDDFIAAARLADPDTLCVLLVDSEDALPTEVKGAGDESADATKQRKSQNATTRKQHLIDRDGWDLKQVAAERIHLMVQCMEAWIVADPDALAQHYKQGFHKATLPARINLEDEPKAEIYKKLAAATMNTQKGEYGKIKHASKLLAMIDPMKVAARCPRFATFTAWLDEQIASA